MQPTWHAASSFAVACRGSLCLTLQDMFSKETDISAFFNLKVCLEPGDLVGFIEGTFGTSGQSACPPRAVRWSTL